MKYVVHPVSFEDEYFFCVYENATNQVIDFFYFEEDAQKEVESLIKGKGFDGFTPAFMLNEIPKDSTKKINNLFKKVLL